MDGLEPARANGVRRVARASVAPVPFVPRPPSTIVTFFDVFVCLPGGVEQAAVSEMWRVSSLAGAAIITWLRWRSCGQSLRPLGEVRRYNPGRLRAILEPARIPASNG